MELGKRQRAPSVDGEEETRQPRRLRVRTPMFALIAPEVQLGE